MSTRDVASMETTVDRNPVVAGRALALPILAGRRRAVSSRLCRMDSPEDVESCSESVLILLRALRGFGASPGDELRSGSGSLLLSTPCSGSKEPSSPDSSWCLPTSLHRPVQRAASLASWSRDQSIRPLAGAACRPPAHIGEAADLTRPRVAPCSQQNTERLECRVWIFALVMVGLTWLATAASSACTASTASANSVSATFATTTLVSTSAMSRRLHRLHRQHSRCTHSPLLFRLHRAGGPSTSLSRLLRLFRAFTLLLRLFVNASNALGALFACTTRVKCSKPDSVHRSISRVITLKRCCFGWLCPCPSYPPTFCLAWVRFTLLFNLVLPNLVLLCFSTNIEARSDDQRTTHHSSLFVYLSCLLVEQDACHPESANDLPIDGDCRYKEKLFRCTGRLVLEIGTSFPAWNVVATIRA